MSKAFKRRWARALESGKFHQASGMLYDPVTQGHCCLGVACVVLGAKRVLINGGDKPYRVYQLNGKNLNDPGADDINFYGRELIGIGFDEQKKLVLMNDGTPRFSFKEIAKEIRKSL